MSKRMKMIFTISVLLNIVFVGVGAGMLYRYCQDIPIPGTMSPDARNFVARTYQNGREEVKPLITEVKARRERVEDILESDNFDRKAYDNAVDDLLETQGKIARHRADLGVEMVGKRFWPGTLFLDSGTSFAGGAAQVSAPVTSVAVAVQRGGVNVERAVVGGAAFGNQLIGG